MNHWQNINVTSLAQSHTFLPKLFFFHRVSGVYINVWKFQRGGGVIFLRSKIGNSREEGLACNSLCGGGMDIFWNYTMAHVTVRLQVSNYSQLSDYNFPDWLEQNTAVYVPITFEEIVLVMIKSESDVTSSVHLVTIQRNNFQITCTCKD